MICDKCHKRPATVHIKKIINGKETKRNLCAQCASKSVSASVDSFNIQDELMHGFSEMLAGFSNSDRREIVKDGRKCPECGSAYSNFQQSGRLGCSKCYEIFKDEIETLLRRLQGSVQHAGKTPPGLKKFNKIEDFKTELNKSIEEEDYERAAVLRDKIKELKKRAES